MFVEQKMKENGFDENNNRKHIDEKYSDRFHISKENQKDLSG